MQGNRRAVVVVAFFIVIIALMQLSRMGILSNPKSLTNEIRSLPTTVSNPLPDVQNKFKVLIIKDPADSFAVRCSENYESLFSKYKMDYDVTTVQQPAQIDSSLDCVIIAFSDYSKYNDFKALFDYMQNGGSVIFASSPKVNGAYYSLASSFGIIESSNGKYSDFIIDKKGIVGKAQRKYTYIGRVLSSTNARLRAECEVYLTNETGTPLLWKVSQGKGYLYMTNSDVIELPTGRGVVSALLFEIAGKSLLYPSYGVITSQLESFPGPSISGDYKIFRETNKNYDSFVKDILWINMLKLTRQYGIIHTISFVESYNSKTEAPFEQGEMLSSALMTYGSETLSNNGEIAFHGYNYRPLGLEGELLNLGWFTPWASFEDMKEATTSALNYFHESFPNYQIRTYIPPEGRIAKDVLSRLTEIMPGIEVVCAPYHNNYDDQLYEDFQTGDSGLFYYSITSGIDGIEWNAQNSLYSLGVISQSIDVPYAVIINNQSWSEIIRDIDDVFAKVFKNMPTIKPMRVYDAAQRIKMYEKMNFVYEETANGLSVHVDNYFDGISFLLRTDRVPVSAAGYNVYQTDTNLYTIMPTMPNFTIRWGDAE